MVNRKGHTQTQSDLSSDFQQALFSTTRKQMRYEPPAVLAALDGLMIKPKRIAAVIKISHQLVRTMTAGRQKCPEKYFPALYELLRLAVAVAKDHVGQAERRELLWGNLSYPPETLDFFKQRIREAEKVLKEELQQ